MSDFTHLHVHSHYSLLDGLPKIKDLVARAKQLGMPAIALTDHGNMYGAIEFYITCKNEGITPIIGMEAYIAPRALHLKNGKQDSKNSHITLLAQNKQGYKNLMTLSTIGFLDGFYYKPRIDSEALRKFSEGIICLSGCPSGEIRRALERGDETKARELASDYKSIFGDRFYIEIQILKWKDPIKMTEQYAEVKKLVTLAKELNLPIVATNDVHYIDSEDAAVHDVIVCINTGNTVHEKKRMDLRDVDLSLYPPDEMKRLFAEFPEALENTKKIADSIDLTLDLETWHYPTYQLPEGVTSPNTYIREQVELGAKKIYGKITPEMQERMEYEFDIIFFKNYSDYFLIFADFMQWAREQNIMTTARGSASGSLVSYCLNITSVDPLKYKLPFDRFLTKKRPSPPDIDCDIQDNRRDEVIDYVRSKYGHKNVAQVCTFGTMMARGSFRDVSRALGKPHVWADRIAKLIPFGAQGHPMTLEKALLESPDLKEEYNSDPEIHEVYQSAQKIEGCARHVSVHAAAVILTPKILTEYVPLQIETKGRNIITQYDMYKLDPGVSKKSVGVLKMDFLGLRNLSILAKALKLVQTIKNKSIDIYHIPTDDKKTFEMLSAGHTFGVFQLSSSGMTRYLKELEPTEIPHLIAMVALYRPGPMEIIPEYITRKNKPSAITYTDPRLKDILEMSYGLFIYQDDILLTAIHLAGYEPDEADAFRKAMGKKVPEVMAAQKEKFYGGCIANGLSKIKAKEIWDAIEPFASYGFNKAHAASYGMLAYRTAYMKANYPAEFMTALLTAESANADKVADAIRECHTIGITVSPPDVNESLGDFTYISDKEIRFGLKAIKNLGTDIISSIIKERKENGPFKSLINFLKRVKSHNLNKKSLEALIKTGALDRLGERNELHENVELLTKYIKRLNSIENTQQTSLFAKIESEDMGLKLKTTAIATSAQKASWERELLGLYVTNHPLTNFHVDSIENLITLKELEIISNSKELKIILSVVSSVKKIFTKKNNEPMLFVEIEDKSHRIEAIVFPKVFEENPDIWIEEAVLVIQGRLSKKDGETKLIIQNALPVTEETLENTIAELAKLDPKSKGHNKGEYHSKTNLFDINSDILITLPNRLDSTLMRDLMEILSNNPGPSQVIMKITDDSDKKVTTRYRINMDIETKSKIENLIGSNSVSIISSSLN